MLVLKDVLKPRLKPGSSGGEEFQPDKYLTYRIKCISKSFIWQHCKYVDYWFEPVAHLLLPTIAPCLAQ